MGDSLAGVALAAGTGSRLRPLTIDVPKALCPVANTPLIDHALDRLESVADRCAVNAHHHWEALAAHVGERAHVSVEHATPLGTAGAVGRLRSWLDGVDVLVVNADTWCPGSLEPFVSGWDRERVRLLIPGGAFGPDARIAAALLPRREVEAMSEEPSGLYEVSWRSAHAEGRLEAVAHDGVFADCGTPADYLEANLLASGGMSVVDPDASVEGEVVESVVWSGARVEAPERLFRAVRTPTRTVVVRSARS